MVMKPRLRRTFGARCRGGWRPALLLAALLAVGACGDDGGATGVDAGAASDAAVSAADTGVVDSGSVDSGEADATAIDADEGSVDAAGTQDAAIIDAALPPVDAPIIDAGAPDAAVAVDAQALADAAATPDAASGLPFNAVHSIFAAKCGPCHTTVGSGGHNIGASNIAQAYADSQLAAYSVMGTKGAASLLRIANGSMPIGGGCTGNPVLDSGKAACLTQAELETLQSWIVGGQLGPL